MVLMFRYPSTRFIYHEANVYKEEENISKSNDEKGQEKGHQGKLQQLERQQRDIWPNTINFFSPMENVTKIQPCRTNSRCTNSFIHFTLKRSWQSLQTNEFKKIIITQPMTISIQFYQMIFTISNMQEQYNSNKQNKYTDLMVDKRIEKKNQYKISSD